MSEPHPTPLRDFVIALTQLLDRFSDEADILRETAPLLARLVARDDWLPPDFARPHPEHYQQYLLHADSCERFSVIAFVWGPGQHTPVHDHTVWGLIGMLRGAESAQPYRWDAAQGLRAVGPPKRLEPGQVETLSPREGDIHQVANVYADQVSISIHVYGANMAAVRRHVYRPDGQRALFVSGYANAVLPNIWDISNRTRLS